MSDEEETGSTSITTSTTPVPEADPLLYPSWVKISQIPHPALVPSFISRREGLPDGSIDPSTAPLSTQLGLLQSAALSPSLASIISNVPAQMLVESIHRRNMQEAKPGEQELKAFRAPQIFSLPPAHYHRTIDPQSSNAVSSATANQTAAELASINVLYGGVKGKVYLDSLRKFLETSQIRIGSEIERLIREKIESLEAVCGKRVLNLVPEGNKKPADLHAIQTFLATPILSKTDVDAMIKENALIFSWLNECTGIEDGLRDALLIRLRGNLVLLVASVPIEQRDEFFAGVDWHLIK
jgi:hypothetical protein